MRSERFDNLADGLTVPSRLLNNCCHHNRFRISIAFLTGRNENILRDAFVIRHHITHAAFDNIAANHLMMRALQHLNQRAFATTSTINANYPRHRTITMQQAAHLLG